LILSSGAKYNQINFSKNHVSGNARKIGVTVIWWFTVTRREDAIVTDPDKSVWKYMLGKQIQEAHNVHGHDTMFSATLVLLVVIGDLRVCDVQNPGVGDGHTKGIAGNILEDKIGSFGWRS